MTSITKADPVRMPSVGQLLAAQVSYQARLLASGRTIIIGVGLPVIMLLASNGNHSTDVTDTAGFAAFGLTLTAWNTYGVRLVAAREAGVLKRWRATPLPHWCYFLGRILATVVVAGGAGAATVVAGILIYGNNLTASGALAALVVFVLGAFAWAAAATALTAVVPTVEGAAPTFILIYFPVIVISGVFGSISEPHWLSTLATYLPAEPLRHALTIALTHKAGRALLPVRDVLVLAIWSVVGLAVAIATFQWEPHRPTQARPARSQQQPKPDDVQTGDPLGPTPSHG